MSTISLESTLTFPNGTTATISLETPMVTDDVVEESMDTSTLNPLEKATVTTEAKSNYREQMAIRLARASSHAMQQIAREMP